MILTKAGKVYVNGKSSSWKARSIRKAKGKPFSHGAKPQMTPITNPFTKLFTLVNGEPNEETDETVLTDQESVLKEF